MLWYDRQLLATLVVVAMLVSCDMVAAAGFWSSQTVSEYYFVSVPRTLTFRISGTRSSPIKFSTTDMQQDRDLFPGSCISSSTNNKNGWERYKYDIVSSTRVRYRSSLAGTEVQLFIVPVEGFALVEEETIRCGAGFLRKDGSSYSRGATPLTQEQENFVFTIQPRTRVTMQLRDRQKEVYWTTTVLETDIRRLGFFMNIYLDHDSWRLETVPLLLSLFSCESEDEAACAWFQGVLLDNTKISLPAPNQIHVNVTRHETRFLNFKFDMKIRLNIFKNDTFTFGLKPPTFKWLYEDNYFEIKTDNVVPLYTFPTDQGRNDVSLTEACLRGRGSCMGRWQFNLASQIFGSQRQFIEFVESIDSYEDLRSVTFWSERMQKYFDPVAYMSFGKSGSDEDRKVVYIHAKPAYEYEISGADTIQIYLRYSLFSNFEPPTSVTQISVLPSPGFLVGELLDVSQDRLWEGNFTMALRLEGESWPSSFNDSSVLLSYSEGSDKYSGYGWNAYKGCVLPQGAVRWGASDGTSNRSELILTFTRCPGYLMVQDEHVMFTFPADVGMSGLDLEHIQDLSFNVTKSPGKFELVRQPFYEEIDVQRGAAAFDIELSGEIWVPNMTTCFKAMISLWSSDASSSAVDNRGWDSPAARESLMINTSTGEYDGFERIDDFTIRVRFLPTSVYDTLRGENITIKIPLKCLVSCGGGCSPNDLLLPSGDNKIVIRPQNGNVSLSFGQDNDYTADMTWLSETTYRNGNGNLFVKVVGDRFEITRASEIAESVISAFVSNSAEPFGFIGKRSEMLLSQNVKVNATCITIPVVQNFKYDIKDDEEVFLSTPGWWMASGRAPMNGTDNAGKCGDGSCPLHFWIFASAGDVRVEWSGHPTLGGPEVVVTEDDVRYGNIWFRFMLVGDQWRKNREPYRHIITSIPTNANGFESLLDQLLPSIEFFNFTTSELFEIVSLRFQGSSQYDIAVDETITIQFDNRTTVSKLPPVFVISNTIAPVFTISVRATAGQAVLSGASAGLTEKVIRRGGAKLFITLFGETWKSPFGSAEAEVRESFRSNTTAAVEKAGFSERKEIVLPPGSAVVTFGTGTSADATEIVVTLAADRGYNIESDEYIQLQLPSSSVSSGIAPAHRLFVLPVKTTAGELLVVDTHLTERDIRRGGSSIVLQLLGEAWSEKVLTDGGDFLRGFSSLSSKILEPHGFFAQRGVILQELEPRLGVNATVRLGRAPRYDIDTDEVLTFTIPDLKFVVGQMPDPATVQITIKTFPRVIVLMADEQFPGNLLNNEFNTLLLRDRISDLLAESIDRVDISVNATTKADNGLTVLHLQFKSDNSAVSLASAATRTNAELGDLLVSLRWSFLYDMLGVRFAYFEDDPPAESDLRVVAEATLAPRIEGEKDWGEISLWIGLAVGIIVLVGAVFAIMHFLGQADLTGAARHSARRREGHEAHGEYTDIPDSLGGELPSTLKRRARRRTVLSQIHREVIENPRGHSSGNDDEWYEGNEEEEAVVEEQEDSGETASETMDRLIESFIGGRRKPVDDIPVADDKSPMKVREPMTMRDYVRSQMNEAEGELPPRQVGRSVSEALVDAGMGSSVV